MSTFPREIPLVIVTLVSIVTGADLRLTPAKMVITDVPFHTTGGFRFTIDDSPVFADSGYNDDAWESGVESFMYQGEQNRHFKGFGWFRIHVALDTALLGDSLFVAIGQTGASELYIDGKKQGTWGTMGRDSKGFEPFVTTDLPVFIPWVPQDTISVFAVRYSNPWYKRYSLMGFPRGFYLSFGYFAEGIAFIEREKQMVATLRTLFTAIPLTIAFLHFFLWLFYRSDRGNLYYALNTLGAAGLTFSVMGTASSHDYDVVNAYFIGFKLSLLTLFVFGVLFLYNIFGQKNRIFIKIFASVSGLMALGIHYISVPLVYTMGFICMIEEIRVLIVALRRKKPGAPLIVAGYVIFTVACSLQMLCDMGIIPDTPREWGFMYLYGFTAMLVTMSLFLAYQFGRTRHQVESLSAQQAETISRLHKEIDARQMAQKVADERRDKLIQAERMATLGILVSGVAHEINNPNNFILLNGMNLRDMWIDLEKHLDTYSAHAGDFELQGIPYSELKSDIPQLLSGIIDGADRIKRIVETLKDFSRKDSGEANARVDLNEVVEASLTILAAPIRKATQRFEFAQYGKPLWVKGNFQRLEQVIINIISNALESLPDGSKGVFVSMEQRNGQNVVVVEDEGKGIDRDILPHILDPFFTTKRDSGGTGLGLSIVYTILKDHNGEISIDNRVPSGTRVEIRLPGFVA